MPQLNQPATLRPCARADLCEHFPVVTHGQEVLARSEPNRRATAYAGMLRSATRACQFVNARREILHLAAPLESRADQP
jgi:hypothetical protein